MGKRIATAPMAPDPGEGCDLAERLANYRSRVEREGRRVAVERLNRAIDDARAGRRAAD